jgi:hypothetical protein
MSSLNPLRRHSPQVSLCIAQNTLNTEIGNAVENRTEYFQEKSLQKYRQSTGTKYPLFFRIIYPPPPPSTHTQTHTHTGACALKSTHFRTPSKPHSFAIAFRICFMALYKTYYWSNP